MLTAFSTCSKKSWNVHLKNSCRLRVQLPQSRVLHTRQPHNKGTCLTAIPHPHATALLAAPGTLQWQVILVCAAVAPLARTLGRTSDMEALSSLLQQITHTVALPCYTFSLGLACMLSEQLFSGIFLGLLRAATGAFLGLIAAVCLEQLCQHRIPLLSTFLLSGSGSSSQRSIAEATARAFGSPQAMSSLLPPRILVPPGLRLALILSCAFPSALIPLQTTLDPAAADFIHGCCIGLLLSLWLVARTLLLWNRSAPGANTDSSPSPAPGFQSLHTWMKLQGNQEVLMPGEGQGTDKTTTTASGWAQQTMTPTPGAEPGRGEVIEAVVTDLGEAGSAAGRDRKEAGGASDPWAAAADGGAGSSVTERLLQGAASLAGAYLPVVALVAGLALGPLIRLPADASQLPWDGTLLSILGSGFVQAVSSLAPALQLLLLLNFACLCTGVDDSVQTPIAPAGVSATAPGAWTRLRCLLLPSQPLDILLLATACLGYVLASSVAAQALGLLAAGGILQAPAACLSQMQTINPELAMVLLVQMLRSNGLLEGMRGDALRQFAVLLFRMIMWGPTLQWIVGLLIMESASHLLFPV